MGLFDRFSSKATDPVCGMSVDKKSAAGTASHAGKTFYFCSKGCAQKFRANPMEYA
ncbi:MAG: YHS domain-containing protein [Thermoplasmatota archaeon]